jgi:hypothetical protein
MEETLSRTELQELRSNLQIIKENVSKEFEEGDDLAVQILDNIANVEETLDILESLHDKKGSHELIRRKTLQVYALLSFQEDLLNDDIEFEEEDLDEEAEED